MSFLGPFFRLFPVYLSPEHLSFALGPVSFSGRVHSDHGLPQNSQWCLLLLETQSGQAQSHRSRRILRERGALDRPVSVSLHLDDVEVVRVVEQHHLVGLHSVDYLSQPDRYLLHEVVVVDRSIQRVPAMG